MNKIIIFYIAYNIFISGFFSDKRLSYFDLSGYY